MDKVKNFIFSINFILCVFVSLGMRIAVQGASIGDAFALLSVCGLLAFLKWVDLKKDINLEAKIQNQLNDIKASVGGLMMKNSVRPSTSDQTMKKFF